MLEASTIAARYGRIPALNGVSLAVGAGEAVGIVGHNGMGKTTLLRTLMGYLPLTLIVERKGGGRESVTVQVPVKALTTPAH